jgi:hypothetical protein
MLFLMALVAVSAAPGREAEALGVRLARTSGIATIAPMMVQKDLTELAKEDPSLGTGRDRVSRGGAGRVLCKAPIVARPEGVGEAKRERRSRQAARRRAISYHGGHDQRRVYGFQENHRCANVQRERQILRTALISVRRRY